MKAETLAKTAGLAVLLGCGQGALAQGTCWPAQDKSSRDSYDWGCKSFQWYLQFTYPCGGGTCYGGFPQYALIEGACLGNYKTCSGSTVSASTLEGTKYFSWNMGYDELTTQWSICEPYKTMTVCEPWEDPDGHNEVVSWNVSIEGWNQVWCN